MYKFEITHRNCFAMHNGKYQELPIGTIITSKNKTAFGGKAKLIQEELVLTVATPDPEPVPEEGSALEEELRQFIFEKTGNKAGGRSTIETLKKRAIKLGWEE